MNTLNPQQALSLQIQMLYQLYLLRLALLERALLSEQITSDEPPQEAAEEEMLQTWMSGCIGFFLLVYLFFLTKKRKGRDNGAASGVAGALLSFALSPSKEVKGKLRDNGEKVSPRMREKLLKLSKMAGGKEVSVHDGQRTLAEQRSLYDRGLTTNDGSGGTAPHMSYDGVDISIEGLPHTKTADLAYDSRLFTRVALYRGHVHVDLKPVAGWPIFYLGPAWTRVRR